MKGTSVKKLIGMFSVAGAVATIIAMIAVHGASAHARYDSSTPAKGAVLATAPASVVVNFGENIQTTNGSFGLTVMKDGGGSVTAGAVTASDTSLTVPLQANAGNGRYVVNWNNTSEDDGDALSGAFAFYVGAGPTAAQTAADQQLDAIETNVLATATAEAARPGRSPARPPPHRLRRRRHPRR